MNKSSDETSLDYSSDLATLRLVTKIVYQYYFLLIIIAGTCGNSITAVALLRSRLRKYSTCQFMGICALLNIGVLLTNTLNMTLTQGFGFHLRSLFDLGWCRLNAFIAQWIRGMASWSLVIVAADRFQQSKSVTRTPTRGNHSVVYVMLGTSVLLVVLNLHYLLFTGSHVSIEGVQFLACLFYKQSNSTMQVFFAKTNTWQELGTIIIVPCILTLTLNILIIKNSFMNPVNNESLKSRSKSRTRRVTAMLLASCIGFLALVAPAQIYYALAFNSEGSNMTIGEYKSFFIQGSIYQCLINTYYAASFVFCFASSSMFRREIKKLFYPSYRSKHAMNRATSAGTYSTHESHPFIQSSQISSPHFSVHSRMNDYIMDRSYLKRATLSHTDGDESMELG